LTVPSNAAFSFGTNNFTLECWVYTTNPANTNGKTIVDSRPDSTNGVYWVWDLTNSGQLRFFNPIGGTSVTSTNPIPFNQWVHIAVTRASGTVTLWVNGTSVASLGSTAESWVSGSLKIGANAFRSIVTDTYWNGYISNLRIVNGTAVYTGAFTPPTAPVTAVTNTSLLLNFTNAGIYDAAVQNNVITVGNAQVSTAQSQWPPSSMLFDGTGDYLYQSDSVGLRFGTGDYTIEFWAYPTGSFAGFPVFVEIGRPSATASVGLQIDINPSGNILVYGGTSTATLLITSASTISTGNWYYIALVRSSAGTKLYINGSQSGSTATDTTNYNVANLWVGVNAGGSNGFYTGYLQDLRLTKGVARTITASPTAPFPVQ